MAPLAEPPGERLFRGLQQRLEGGHREVREPSVVLSRLQARAAAEQALGICFVPQIGESYRGSGACSLGCWCRRVWGVLFGMLFGVLFELLAMMRARFCEIDGRALLRQGAVWGAGTGAVLGCCLGRCLRCW